MNYPTQLASTSNGKLLVVEAGGSRLAVYDQDGNFERHIGESGALPGQLNGVSDAVVDSQGNIFVADSRNHRVQVFDLDTGEPLWSFGQQGDGDGELNAPRSVTIDREGLVHVVDTGNARVQVFTPGGFFERSYGSRDAGEDSLSSPHAVSVDPLGNSWVSDPIGGHVQVYKPDGSPLLRFGELQVDGFAVQPIRVALTPDNTFYIQVNLVEIS